MMALGIYGYLGEKHESRIGVGVHIWNSKKVKKADSGDVPFLRDGISAKKALKGYRGLQPGKESSKKKNIGA